MITTNTIYSGTHKDISVWRKFLECMADKKTLDQSAEICGITHHTAFVWRHKLLDALAETADNTILNDMVEADETFLPVSYKGNAMHFESLPSEHPRNRGGLHTRGLSDELVCIPCAVDLKGNSVSRIAKLGQCDTSLHFLTIIHLLLLGTYCNDVAMPLQRHCFFSPRKKNAP